MPASALSTDNRRGRMWASAPTKMEEFALKLTEQFPTVGDYVMLDYVENGDSRILATLPRRTCFTRREPGCAIRAALAAGELDPARWKSWQKLHTEAESRAELLHRKREWSKNVALSRKARGAKK